MPADCVNTGNSGRTRESRRPNQAHEAEVCKNADSGNRRACDFDLHFRIYSIALVITEEFFLCVAVTTAATASTFGLASVPGLAAGIVGGSSAYKACEIFFDFVEEQIW